ncbi:MAG: hypothetical protein ACOYYF_07185, partial [Chloroflexota bacterium]
GLNGTADKVLQLPKRGRYGQKIQVRAPPIAKSFCRFPEFSAGDLEKKVISIALYGFSPFSLQDYNAARLLHGFFHQK